MHVAVGLLVASALWVLPGLAVVQALLPSLGRARRLVAAPAVSAGILYTCGQAATLLGLPVDWRLGAAVTLAACVALVIRTRSGTAVSTARLPRPVVVSAALGSVLSAGLWLSAVASTTAVPTHDDGYNHGVMVARLLEVRSLAPADLFLPGPVQEQAAGFYPLALHQQAAVLVQTTGIDVALALSLSTLVPVVLCLPLGMALLTRRLLPDHVPVAVAAPVLVAVQPVLMYSMSWWGGLTMAIGLALFPGFLDVLLDVTERLRPAGAVVGAFGVVGFAGVHTSEVPLLAGVATALVLGQVAGPRSVGEAVRRTAVLAVPFVLALVLLVPVAMQLAVVYDQTTTNAPGQIGAVGVAEAVGRVLLLQVGHPPAAPLAMAVAAWLGLVIVAAQGGRTARTWVALCLAVAGLSLWLWAWPGPVINLLTSFMYSSAPRMTYVLVLLLVPLIAAGLVLPLQSWVRLAQQAPTRPPRLAPTAAATAVLALAGAFVTTSVSATARGVQENYEQYSLIGPDQRAAFRFLSREVSPGDRVLNQIQDGSPWMYSLEGVQPLIPGKSDTYGTPKWAGVRRLLMDAGTADRDPAVARLLLDHRVRFVYVDERVFPGRRAELLLPELQQSPAFREVFRAGTAHVFAMQPSRLAGREQDASLSSEPGTAEGGRQDDASAGQDVRVAAGQAAPVLQPGELSPDDVATAVAAGVEVDRPATAVATPAAVAELAGRLAG